MLVGSAWAVGALLTTALSTVASAATTTPGVTATTITIGIPYVDLSALASLGVKLTQGSFPDAYNALISNINAEGGINGRKIVAKLVPVDPSGTAPAATACTQLTEDDKVFVAIAPLSPDCYLAQHHTPTIGAQFQGTLPAGSAPNFSLAPPASAYDPVQLAVFAHKGAFKGKRVGVYAGTTTDQPEMQMVVADLRKLHVDVVQTAVNSAPPSDETAATQQTGVIAERFKSAGINEVVAVGQGSAGWPIGLQRNQSTYNPPFIATSYTSLAGVLGTQSGLAPYVKNVLTSSPAPTGLQVWQDPGIQRCVKEIKKAYPSDTITPYNPTVNGSDHSYVSVEQACQEMALFTALAKAAGRNLTVQSLTRAGESLKGIPLPGAGGPVSFAPGRPYALGLVFLGHYDPSTGMLAYGTKSSS
jgi:hypothetical protein